jgi:hypothetical protein
VTVVRSTSALQPDQARPESGGTAVNGGLTQTRARPVIENSEYTPFSPRVLRATAAASAAEMSGRLARMLALADDIESAIRQTTSGLRAAGNAPDRRHESVRRSWP